MEESSNGKLREIQKVETHDGDEEAAGEFKTEAEAESMRAIVVNGIPEPVIENRDGDDSCEAESNDQSSTQKVDSGEVEEEIIAEDSVVDSVEPEVSFVEVLVEQVEASGVVAELESMVIEDNIFQSLDETNRDSKVIDETIASSSDANDGSSAVETEAVSKAIEEMPLASSDEKGIEQIPLPTSDDKCEVPPATDVVSEAIEGTDLPVLEQNPEESSGTADLKLKERVDMSSQEAANAGSVDNNPGIPASTENQPVTSLSWRNIQPTSWRSCCGLLEILRPSDR